MNSNTILMSSNTKIDKTNKEQIKNESKTILKKERCAMKGCKKKLGMVKYTCNCGKNFCIKHKLAESHNCTFDFQKEGKKIIAEKNPVIVKPKVIAI